MACISVIYNHQPLEDLPNMKKISIYLLLLLCAVAGRAQNLSVASQPEARYATIGNIAVPAGWQRVSLAPQSFGAFLRGQALYTSRNTVYLYNGEPKQNQSAQFAVLKVDVGKRDLQQCADATMRLWAEFLWAADRKSEIGFDFVNGWHAAYSPWAKGGRIWVKGNKTGWKTGAASDTSYRAFRKYLDMVFSYAGTASLAKELKKKSLDRLEVGDLFLVGGSPGHTVIVVDMATNARGQRIVMLAQSYMPAQEIHVLQNPAQEMSPWYLLGQGNLLETPEYVFDWSAVYSYQ